MAGGKLSNQPTNSSPVATDTLIGVKGGVLDVQVPIGSIPVSGSMITASAIGLGYAQITSNATCPSSVGSSNQQAAGLSAAVTIPAGGRKIKITAFVGECFDTGANGGVGIAIWDGTVGSGTQLALSRTFAASKSANASIPLICMAVVTPSAGSKTYNVGMFEVGGVGTATLAASSTEPAFILVEAI